MPELPDLQVFSRNLKKELHGKTVAAVNVPETKKLNVTVTALKHKLEGQKVKNVVRDGKELHIEFSGGDVLALHLMLHGQLYLFDDKNDHTNTIVELTFEDGSGLAMTDYQRQATPTLNPDAKNAPDALGKDMTTAYLEDKLGSTRSAVKNVLLDQKIIRGIGNAYADEILWKAGISPFSAANKIPAAQIKTLAKAIKTVLENAEQQILKSHPDIISGEVRDFLDIHNSKKTHSPTGAVIHTKTANGRKTYYTDEQKQW